MLKVKMLKRCSNRSGTGSDCTPVSVQGPSSAGVECDGRPVRGSCMIVPLSRRAYWTSDVDQARLLAPSSPRRLADQPLPRTQMTRTTSPRAADYSFRRSALLICPGLAADRSVDTTVLRRWYTRRERTARRLCCWRTWRDGVACRRRSGDTVRRGERWRRTPGCSRPRTTEGQAQTLAGLLRRLRWWVTDAGRSSRTDSCLLGRTGASQAPLLSLRIRVEAYICLAETLPLRYVCSFKN